VQHSGALILRLTIGAAAAALAAVVIAAGEPGQPGWWAVAPAFWLWMISPAVAAGLFTGKNPSTGRLIVATAFLVAFIVSSAIGYYRGLLRPLSSTSSLIVIFLPLYQWAALIVLLIAERGCALLVRRYPHNRANR